MNIIDHIKRFIDRARFFGLGYVTRDELEAAKEIIKQPEDPIVAAKRKANDENYRG